MARRTASAQLIHANPGPAAPLIHASVGPAAPLASAPHLGSAPLTSAPHVGGGGRSRKGGDGDSAGGGNAPVAVLSEQAAAGSGAAMRGIKGRTETVASIGSRKFNAAQVRSAIDRGLQGHRLSREDQAIYDAYNARNKKAQEDAAAKAAEAKAEQDRRNKLDDQIALQNNQAKNQEAAAVAADKRKQEAAQEAAQEARRQAESKKYNEDKAWLKLNGFDAEALGIENLFSTPLTEDYKKKLLDDRENDAWNEAHGVDKGTRLSANEKKNIENGTHAWGADPSVTQKYEQDKKELQGLLTSGTYSDREYADAMRDLKSKYDNAPRGIYQKPQDPNRPNIQDVNGVRYIQNGTKWEKLDESEPQTAQEIVANAYTAPDGSRYIADGKGGVTLLPSAKQEPVDDRRSKYVLGRLEAARKAFDNRDTMAEGYDANATFDSEAAIKSAGADWDAVYGGGNQKPAAAQNPPAYPSLEAALADPRNAELAEFARFYGLAPQKPAAPSAANRNAAPATGGYVTASGERKSYL